MTGRRPLTPEELFRFVVAAKTSRDKALFALCCWTGARLCEALALNVRDLVELRPEAPGWTMRQQVEFARRNTKGKQSGRRVPLHPRPSVLVQLYLEDRAAHGGRPVSAILWEPLFTARNHGEEGRLSNRQGRRLFVVTAKAIGLENVGSHSGRKSFGQGLHSSGVPLQSITAALGHHDPKHTMRYFGVNDADLARAVNSLPSGEPEPAAEPEPT